MLTTIAFINNRGGTSRAVMFREHDLATYSEDERRAIILAALGSPDPYGREVDGLGGGISSLSKAAIVGHAPVGSDADVTFRFAQIDVDRIESSAADLHDIDAGSAFNFHFSGER